MASPMVAGIAALVWRFVLTTGTGSIFGFLVARQAYQSALLAPLFILCYMIPSTISVPLWIPQLAMVIGLIILTIAVVDVFCSMLISGIVPPWPM